MVERIFYTDEEWDTLAEIVYKMRKKNPVSALKTLVDAAMKQMPKDRQRKITNFGPIAERIRLLDEAVTTQAERAYMLEAQLETLKGKSVTRADVLSSLTDFELVSMFGSRILNLCLEKLKVAVVNVDVAAPAERKTERPPRVGVVGLLPKQYRIVSDALPGIEIVDIDQHTSNLPLCDWYILWIDFVRHGSLNAKHTRYSGGVQGLIKLIQERYP